MKRYFERLSRTPRVKLSTPKLMAFLVLYICFLGVFTEAVGRILVSVFSVGSASYGYPDGLYVYDSKVDYRYTPNFVGTFDGPGFDNIEIRINSLGFRDYEFSPTKEPGVERIVVLGDSVTFGAGVKLEDTFVKQLEDLLNTERKSYQVINGGVNAYHFEHYYNFINEYLPELQPDHVIIGFCINDVRPKKLAFPYRIVTGQSLVHGAKGFIRDSALFQIYETFLNSTTIGRERYRVRWINEVVGSWNDERLVGKLRMMLEDAKRRVEKQGMTFSVVIFPELSQIADYDSYGAPRDTLLKMLGDLKIRHLDLYDTFAAKSNVVQYYLRGDTVHFTPEGHQMIAQELYQFLRQDSSPL